MDPPEEASSAAAAALHGGAGGAVVATWEARQDRAGLEAANASNAPSQASALRGPDTIGRRLQAAVERRAACLCVCVCRRRRWRW